MRAPHATVTGYSRDALKRRFPDAEVCEDLHLWFSEGEKGKSPQPGALGETPRKRSPQPGALGETPRKRSPQPGALGETPRKRSPQPGARGETPRKKSLLAPDVLVALDVPRRNTRADYDADDLGPPDFVLEVLSRSTWRHDVGRKLDVYQKIGVRECLLFDVTGEDLAGLGLDLWGYALTPTGRRPLEERVLPNGERGVYSAVLGLVAYVAAREPPTAGNETWALTMRWHDPATGADIPDYDQLWEREERALAGEARALAGEERALAVAQTERTRTEAERTRAEAAETRAEAAETRTQTAERTAQAARRRIAELEERLRRHAGS